MDNQRPRSSVYSDAFELEEISELIDQITADAREQQNRKVRALEQELLAELQKAQRDHKEARDRFHAVYSVLLECASVATKVSFVINDVKRSFENEMRIWLASCTSF